MFIKVTYFYTSVYNTCKYFSTASYVSYLLKLLSVFKIGIPSSFLSSLIAIKLWIGVHHPLPKFCFIFDEGFHLQYCLLSSGSHLLNIVHLFQSGFTSSSSFGHVSITSFSFIIVFFMWSNHCSVSHHFLTTISLIGPCQNYLLIVIFLIQSPIVLAAYLRNLSHLPTVCFYVSQVRLCSLSHRVAQLGKLSFRPISRVPL